MSPTSYRTALPRDIAFRSQRRIYYSTDVPTLSIANSLFFVKFADSARFQLLPRWERRSCAPISSRGTASLFLSDSGLVRIHVLKSIDSRFQNLCGIVEAGLIVTLPSSDEEGADVVGERRDNVHFELQPVLRHRFSPSVIAARCQLPHQVEPRNERS